MKISFPLVCLVSSMTAGFAEDSAIQALEQFRKEVQATESEKSDRYPENIRFSSQLRMIRGAIERADYNQARQMLTNLNGYGLPEERLVQWQKLVEKLDADLKQREAEAAEKWRKEVDALLADTRRGCLEAGSSAGLDELLVRCAALQMRRETTHNVLNDRTIRKINGIAATLTAWTSYLDFRDSGSPKRANQFLRDLRRNDSGFPVLTAAEIDSRFVPEDESSGDAITVVRVILAKVKGPDDLAAALTEVQKAVRNPADPERGNSLRSEERRLKLLADAWDAVQRKDAVAAIRALDRFADGGGLVDVQESYEPARRQIFSRLVQLQTAEWTQIPMNSGEDGNSYLNRLMKELHQKEDFATLLKVMELSDQINRRTGQSNFISEQRAIQSYLGAKRLEEAGDTAGALNAYRSVIRSEPGSYLPIRQAEAAVKRLGEANPEALKESGLENEVRALRQQIQILQGRQPPRPPVLP